ncbi:Uncharacterised protein [Klebsiella pneumoniae]|nr:Uncharacterised protein [Klebsiella pneumoniae]
MIHQYQTIGQPQCFVDIMRHQHDGAPENTVDAAHLGLKCAAGDRIQCAEGLIH